VVTTWRKDEHFICKLKMEAEIACAHTVKLTAPGLTIDKAGSVANELTYDFAAGAGLVEQDVGIIGSVVGRFKLYGKITSPFFISHDQLKIKNDEIDITITDEPPPDGFVGDMAGIFNDSVNTSSIVGSLYVRITNVEVGRRFNYEFDVGGFNFELSASAAGIKVIDPDGVVTYRTPDPGSGTNGFNLDKVGVYLIYYMERPRVISGSSLSAVGNNNYVYTLKDGEVVIATQTVTKQGTGLAVDLSGGARSVAPDPATFSEFIDPEVYERAAAPAVFSTTSHGISGQYIPPVTNTPLGRVGFTAVGGTVYGVGATIYRTYNTTIGGVVPRDDGIQPTLVVTPL